MDMRSKNVIENDGTRKDILALEVLLDIRDLLKKQEKISRKDVTRIKRVSRLTTSEEEPKSE